MRVQILNLEKVRLFLWFVSLSAIMISCSENSTDLILEPIPYSPPKLTQTSWEMIENPETAGWSSEKLQVAYTYSQRIPTAAVMIIYKGKVLFYWGDILRKFWVHSCRKSFLNALYGIHVQEGNINLSKNLAELGIDDTPPGLSALEKTATIRMLLQSRSGIYHEAAAEAPAMKAARPVRYSHEPGSYWYYNNWDFNALGTIFEQETGTRIFEEFENRIAIPIGMEDYQVSDGFYQYEDVSCHPAYHFRMSARDMARFGLLFLQAGSWQGNQIIAAEWIDESTTSYSDAGSAGGYGYLWWVAVDGRHLPGIYLPEGSYSAQGYNGHVILIIPEMDLVIVHRVNTDEDQQVTGLELGILVGLILDAKK
jgi:CubicO group peptidase (beta-lactamase class C family)